MTNENKLTGSNFIWLGESTLILKTTLIGITISRDHLFIDYTFVDNSCDRMIYKTEQALEVQILYLSKQLGIQSYSAEIYIAELTNLESTNANA
jgi:hypothetical protein